MERGFKGRWSRVGAGCCAVLLVGIAVELSLADAALLASSAPAFAQAKNYSTGRYPVALALGDLNNDGKQDITTANFGGQTVSVLLNRGGGRFGVRRDYPTGRGAHSVAISDVNGDGNPDLAIANRDANTISVRFNRGDGSFGARRDYRMRPSPNWIASGDLTGDDKPDLAVATRNADVVSVLVNNGDGTFAAGRDYRVIGGPFSVAIGDGALDLATPSQVLLNEGGGSFQPPRTLPGLDELLGGDVVTIGDLNGDGKPELAGAACEQFFVFVFLNRGDGSFRAPRRYHTSSGSMGHVGCPASVAIADLNADRRPELAFVNGTRVDTVSVLTNRGDGSFPSPTGNAVYETENDPGSIAIGDFNGDSKPDLAAAGSYGSVSVLANVTGRCAVPNVERRRLRIARQTIEYAGCRVGTVRRAYSTAIGAGWVISEKPKPGTLLRNRAKVNLVVSRGRQS